MRTMTLQYFLTEGAAILARQFGAAIANAWRSVVADQVRTTARLETFYRARVPGLRQVRAPWPNARYAWRGTCPVCRVDALCVDPWTGVWLCAEGRCPPRGPLAPITLAMLLGESLEGAPPLLLGLREQYDAAHLAWQFAEAAARGELGGDRAPPS